MIVNKVAENLAGNGLVDDAVAHHRLDFKETA